MQLGSTPIPRNRSRCFQLLQQMDTAWRHMLHAKCYVTYNHLWFSCQLISCLSRCNTIWRIRQTYVQTSSGNASASTVSIFKVEYKPRSFRQGTLSYGARCSADDGRTMLHGGMWRVRVPLKSLSHWIFLNLPNSPHDSIRDDPASNRNEYQEC
jgi:hypothetical protein